LAVKKNKKNIKDTKPAKTKKTGKAKKTKNSAEWPTKRNVFFRPQRLEYVRKLSRPEGCVFCAASGQEISFASLCVFKTRYSQIVLNKYPYNNGHLLVLPLEHIGHLLELSPERYEDLHKTLRLAVQAVQAIYNPNGYNLGMNQGATGGAGIPDHLHYHIVPRWNGDLNFFPLIANTKLVVETLEQSYERFSNYFAALASQEGGQP
jgi:ATP adenylyltransferase